MSKPKKITIDMLAGIMNRSFENMSNDVKGLKNDIVDLKDDMREVKEDISNIKNRLESVEQKISFSNDNRLSRLEDEVRVLKNKLS